MEWWFWIVLNSQLDRLSHCLAGDLGHHTQAEVDPRSDATGCDHVAIFDDPSLDMRGADQGQ